MYAIIRVAGSQLRVQEGDHIQVPRLKEEPGSQIQIPDVLLVSDEGKVSIGSPTVAGAAVEALVASHGVGDKVMVFKMKRRKNYRRKRGHRQPFTELEIQKISTSTEQIQNDTPKEE